MNGNSGTLYAGGSRDIELIGESQSVRKFANEIAEVPASYLSITSPAPKSDGPGRIQNATAVSCINILRYLRYRYVSTAFTIVSRRGGVNLRLPVSRSNRVTKGGTSRIFMREVEVSSSGTGKDSPPLDGPGRIRTADLHVVSVTS